VKVLNVFSVKVNASMEKSIGPILHMKYNIPYAQAYQLLLETILFTHLSLEIRCFSYLQT